MLVKVIEEGFYGGTYYKAKDEPQEVPDAVARQFMAPYGHQLQLPKEAPSTTANEQEPPIESGKKLARTGKE